MKELTSEQINEIKEVLGAVGVNNYDTESILTTLKAKGFNIKLAVGGSKKPKTARDFSKFELKLSDSVNGSVEVVTIPYLDFLNKALEVAYYDYGDFDLLVTEYNGVLYFTDGRLSLISRKAADRVRIIAREYYFKSGVDSVLWLTNRGNRIKRKNISDEDINKLPDIYRDTIRALRDINIEIKRLRYGSNYKGIRVRVNDFICDMPTEVAHRLMNEDTYTRFSGSDVLELEYDGEKFYTLGEEESGFIETFDVEDIFKNGGICDRFMSEIYEIYRLINKDNPTVRNFAKDMRKGNIKLDDEKLNKDFLEIAEYIEDAEAII